MGAGGLEIGAVRGLVLLDTPPEYVDMNDPIYELW